jgi:hypothetical protein
MTSPPICEKIINLDMRNLKMKKRVLCFMLFCFTINLSAQDYNPHDLVKLEFVDKTIIKGIPKKVKNTDSESISYELIDVTGGVRNINRRDIATIEYSETPGENVIHFVEWLKTPNSTNQKLSEEENTYEAPKPEPICDIIVEGKSREWIRKNLKCAIFMGKYGKYDRYSLKESNNIIEVRFIDGLATYWEYYRPNMPLPTSELQAAFQRLWIENHIYD